MLPLSAGLDERLRGRGGRTSTSTTTSERCRFPHRRFLGLLSRYPQRRPLLRCNGLRRDRSAAPTAPYSTPCSTRWSAGPRRCWCSPAKSVGHALSGSWARAPLEWPELLGVARALRPRSFARLTQVTEGIDRLRRQGLGSSLEAIVTSPARATWTLPNYLLRISEHRRLGCA